jgi:undecaprenyl-phosphate galactose phosphotransferase/putative colanic acid biosynthesis UDP-glucose lipid carrier transferase
VLLNVSYICSYFISNERFSEFNSQDAKTVLLFSNIIWCFLASYFHAYRFIRLEPIERILFRTFQLVFYLMALVFVIIVGLKYNEVSRTRLLAFSSLFFVAVCVGRVIFISLLKKLRRKGYNFRNVIIIGANKTGFDMRETLSGDLSYGYRVLGFFDNDIRVPGVLGEIAEALPYISTNPVHEIYMAVQDYDTKEIRELTNYCERNFIRIRFVPYFRNFTKSRKLEVSFYGTIPVVSLRKEPLEYPLNRILKYGFDVLFTAVLFALVFWWLFPVLILLVKLSSKGPVFFKQQRSGKNSRTFWCYKFRTMRVNDMADELQATRNDARITPIGRIMRKTSLDELPQFINVLKGDMSIVGPRPHMLKHTQEYSDLINNYLVRHFAKAGITGWAQVNGFRGETKNVEEMEKRVEFDIWYIENWSFLLDLKIIFRTLTLVFFKNKNTF